MSSSKVKIRVLKNGKSLSRKAASIQLFLDDNYPVSLPWDDENLVLLIATQYHDLTGRRLVGACAVVPGGDDPGRAHVCALAIAKDMRNKGIGTELLKKVAITYPTQEVTLAVAFEDAHLLSFYYRKGYATLKEVNTELGTIVLSLVQLKLLRDVPLPLISS